MEDYRKLHDEINSIVGVVENGLFIDMTDEVIVGTNDGVKKIKAEGRKNE